MNPATPNRRGRDLLRVADCIYIGFHEAIEAVIGQMSADDLDLIEQTASEFTTTNCGWSEYEMVKTKAFVDAVLVRRSALRRLAEQQQEIAGREA